MLFEKQLFRIAPSNSFLELLVPSCRLFSFRYGPAYRFFGEQIQDVDIRLKCMRHLAKNVNLFVQKLQIPEMYSS
jgi:hypothetical protein